MPDSSAVRVALWAPFAQKADAVVAGERRPMTRASNLDAGAPAPNGGHPDASGLPDPDETWVIDLPAGTDYLLSIDDGERRPDPRSRWQPGGVHQASRTFDAAAHAWADGQWPGLDALGRVFYEMHVGTFTDEGTLDAAIERLPHLVELGVEVVELMPVAAFPGERGWGYDGVALYAVQQSYGGPAALQRFVDAAHGLGLGVCLDVVYNHFGPAGNYAPVFGPYFTERHHTPWGAGINLDDRDNGGVRRFIVDNALQWLRDFHIDALRLDAVHALADDSGRHILAELSDEVHAWAKASGRTATLIAESDLNNPAMITPTVSGGLGMDGQWDDDVHHALHSYLTGETFGYYVDFGAPETLKKAFEHVFVHDGGYSTFREQNWGAPVADNVDRSRFVVFTQNHDQVGNRALGDRPDVRLDAGTVAGGAALLLLGPFTPLLFQGQEWGTRTPFQYFTHHDDELGELVRIGRTKEFATHGWEQIYGPGMQVPNPQSAETFLASKLDWTELGSPAHRAMLDWHRRLIALRGQLIGPRQPVAADYGDGWFRLVHGQVTVIVAPTDAPAELRDARGRVAASFGDANVADGRVHLGPHAVVVLTG